MTTLGSTQGLMGFNLAQMLNHNAAGGAQLTETWGQAAPEHAHCPLRVQLKDAGLSSAVHIPLPTSGESRGEPWLPVHRLPSPAAPSLLSLGPCHPTPLLAAPPCSQAALDGREQVLPLSSLSHLHSEKGLLKLRSQPPEAVRYLGTSMLQPQRFQENSEVPQGLCPVGGAEGGSWLEPEYPHKGQISSSLYFSQLCSPLCSERIQSGCVSST